MEDQVEGMLAWLEENEAKQKKWLEQQREVDPNFGKTFCDYHQAYTEADLSSHGPTCSVLELDCGCLMVCTKDKTEYWIDNTLVHTKENTNVN